MTLIIDEAFLTPSITFLPILPRVPLIDRIDYRIRVSLKEESMVYLDLYDRIVSSVTLRELTDWKTDTRTITYICT